MPRYLRRELRRPMRLPTATSALRSTWRRSPAILDDFRARASRRSPSASFTPTQTPRTSGGHSTPFESCGRRCRSSPRTRSPASGASTSAANTAVLSAYVQPTAESYLQRLERDPARRGLHGSPYIMQSNGGVTRWRRRARIPITMVESGPAAASGAPRSRGADRRAEPHRARHRRHDREVLAHRERRGPDLDRLLDRA